MEQSSGVEPEQSCASTVTADCIASEEAGRKDVERIAHLDCERVRKRKSTQDRKIGDI